MQCYEQVLFSRNRETGQQKSYDEIRFIIHIRYFSKLLTFDLCHCCIRERNVLRRVLTLVYAMWGSEQVIDRYYFYSACTVTLIRESTAHHSGKHWRQPVYSISN